MTVNWLKKKVKKYIKEEVRKMATKRIRLEDGKKFYVVFKNPGDPVINLYLYNGKEIDLGDKAFKKFSSLYKEFFKSQGRDKLYEEFYKWVKEELIKCIA